jgi:hypothetical protein
MQGREKSLPASFLDTRDVALQGQLSEADPADAEFAVNGTRTPAQLATVPVSNRELAGRLRLDHLSFG